MGEPVISPSLDKVYAEAGQWIRMSNTLIWSMGAILIPTSLSCIGLAQQFPLRRGFLAGASIFMFAFWVYVSNILKVTCFQARQVLMAIERSWDIPQGMALYNIHGQVGTKWYSLFKIQILALSLFIVLWVVLLTAQWR